MTFKACFLTDLDYCGRHKPCLNGGICKNTNITSQPFHCICPRGWKGETCEKSKYFHINSSLEPPVFNCVQELSARHILTSLQDAIIRVSEGLDSFLELKPCELNPCKRGHCRENSDGGFDCVCEPGWRGELCDQSESLYAPTAFVPFNCLVQLMTE